MNPSVSIVVNNYNYERWVEAAIESALAQTYSDVEVLVVDDGSTDGSWERIERYSDRAQTIRKENGGQASALNVGFEACRGEIVIFLDSDDLLFPEMAEQVAAAYVPGCAKVQCRLSIVDAHGERTGAFPAATIPMPTGDVVVQMAEAGRYVTPVTSGNAYSRSALEQLLPIPEEAFRHAADAYLDPLVPFYGPVISIDRELGAYRAHGANEWQGRAGLDQLRRFVENDWLKQRYTLEVAREQGRELPADLAMRDWLHVLHRLSYLRLDPATHPAAGDTRFALARAGVRAIFRSPELAGAERAFYAAVMVTVAAAPDRLAPRAVDWANSNRPRPAWMRFLRRAARAARWPGRTPPGQPGVPTRG